VVEGVDLDAIVGSDHPPLVINRNVAEELALVPGATVTVRSECSERYSVLPTVDFVVSGIAEFPFDPVDQMTAAVAMPDFDRACGSVMDEADVFLVASRAGEYPEMAVKAITRLRPDLHAYSNAQLVDRFQQVGFSYFRQISTVLATITLFFAFLLISALLTVSVNQRFAEIAALRALGFSRRRIATDLLWESILMVGTGGLLALPLGLALATWLDRILKAMPGLPGDLHFFVLHPAAVATYVALLSTAGVLAAAYPVFLASRLPMASTLRNEVVG
ncbi:MAG: ABC transporter permease, partial [Vicinamibacterales bacterium]|nr:ABC transporter permease [Vicinamibacterales bacterium]